MTNATFQKIYHKVMQLQDRAYIFREAGGISGFLNLEGNRVFTHITYCKVGNAGDTVLSQCVRRTFETYFTKLNWKIKSVNAVVDDDFIREINKTKGVILGGGGLFLPDTNENSISGWQWAVSKEMMDKIDVPLIIFSVGYNFFPGQKNSDLFVNSIANLVQNSAFIGLRNSGSVRAVREIIPIEFRDKVIYQPCTTTLIRKLYKDELPKKRTTGNICINMAFDRSQLRFGDRKHDVLCSVARAMRQIEDDGYHICVVYHMNQDAEFKPYLDAEHINYTEKNLTTAKPKEVYEFYNQADLVFGMRGHAQMIPFGLNCEIISLGTHDKLKWFLEDIDAGDWFIDINDTSMPLDKIIYEKFNKIHIDNQQMTKEHLLEQQEKLYDITLRNMHFISELL